MSEESKDIFVWLDDLLEEIMELNPIFGIPLLMVIYLPLLCIIMISIFALSPILAIVGLVKLTKRMRKRNE